MDPLIREGETPTVCFLLSTLLREEQRVLLCFILKCEQHIGYYRVLSPVVSLHCLFIHKSRDMYGIRYTTTGHLNRVAYLLTACSRSPDNYRCSISQSQHQHLQNPQRAIRAPSGLAHQRAHDRYAVLQYLQRVRLC